MDARLIRDFTEYEISERHYKNLRGIKYHTKQDTKPKLGLVSQEVATAEPLLVEGQPMQINYEALSAVLVEMVKDLNHRLSNVENNLKQKGKKNATV